MKIGIMQPYVFPYIGYFQLIKAVDLFVFYDDVNFIKKGFVNKNSILVNNQRFQFTIPCKKVSQNKSIHNTGLAFDNNSKLKFLNTLKHAYSKAPYFNTVYPILEDFISNSNSELISEFSIDGIKLIAKYLGINTHFKVSSLAFPETKPLVKTERLIAIATLEGATTYINAIGGKKLYDPAEFLVGGVDLRFLKTDSIKYGQLNDHFEANLSIIDVLMFNSRDEIQSLLNQYELE